MVKVGAIIQARLGSERLPNKALLPLPFGGGPALLAHVVNRAKPVTGVHEVIVATTMRTTDEAIYSFCMANNHNCYRGSEDDVLDRFVKAAEMYQLDVVVRLTGDNPFISPETIESVVQQHIQGEVDYSITEGLPLGTNIEVISYTALERAAKEATEQADREHVTPYIRRNSSFKKQTLNYSSVIKDLRLTVDYPSDYALASLIYNKLYKEDSLFTLKAIENLVQQNPWLIAVNVHNTQRTAFASEVEEFQEAQEVLKTGGFTRVLEKLQQLSK